MGPRKRLTAGLALSRHLAKEIRPWVEIHTRFPWQLLEWKPDT